MYTWRPRGVFFGFHFHISLRLSRVHVHKPINIEIQHTVVNIVIKIVDCSTNCCPILKSKFFSLWNAMYLIYDSANGTWNMHNFPLINCWPAQFSLSSTFQITLVKWSLTNSVMKALVSHSDWVSSICLFAMRKCFIAHQNVAEAWRRICIMSMGWVVNMLRANHLIFITKSFVSMWMHHFWNGISSFADWSEGRYLCLLCVAVIASSNNRLQL